ncbi:MAG: hypothetical protein DLM58_18075 [Pseudonocardiales bacterium]|nr:MAG: hypothetical protein DLM58_18075 [Pseudonocardiales bacterium]
MVVPLGMPPAGTPALFAPGFGLPASEQNAIRAWLSGGGLRIDSASVAGEVSGLICDVDGVGC